MHGRYLQSIILEVLNLSYLSLLLQYSLCPVTASVLLGFDEISSLHFAVSVPWQSVISVFNNEHALISLPTPLSPKVSVVEPKDEVHVQEPYSEPKETKAQLQMGQQQI